MEEVLFLTIENVLAIHRRMIERYGGDSTIRGLGLIDSAVSMPKQTFEGNYLHPSVGAMAAAYLFHLCSNHGFADGNKRTAVGAALVFLDVNGYELALTIDELEQITFDVAGGKLDKSHLTRLLAAAVRPIE
jgi:death-on-curing protein